MSPERRALLSFDLYAVTGPRRRSAMPPTSSRPTPTPTPTPTPGDHEPSEFAQNPPPSSTPKCILRERAPLLAAEKAPHFMGTSQGPPMRHYQHKALTRR